MSIGRGTAPVREVKQAAWAPVPESNAGAARLSNSVEAEPLDWDVAVRAAGVLLAETFDPAGSADDPVVTDMARDLAARLCAYHEVGAAVAHMNTRVPITSDDS